MIPLDVLGSESLTAGLLQQVRWRDRVTCPRCRSTLTVRNGSYGHVPWYLCTDCDRTFNDETGTIVAHSKAALRKWLFSIYAFLRSNTSLRQRQREIDVTYKSMHRRVERFTRALDAPSLALEGPVEIDEGCVSAGKKGREPESRSRRFVSKASSLRAQLEHGLKEAIYNMFPWVRDQPDRDLDRLMKEVDPSILKGV